MTMMNGQYRDALRIASVGLEFGLTVIICFAGGYWFDRICGTSPVFMLLGVSGGLVGGMYLLVRQARRLERRMRNGRE